MAQKKIWYVYATGHTNEVVATRLAAENCKPILCQDGTKRPMWVCDYSFVTDLVKNEKEGQLEFDIWFRVGEYGPVKKWPFLRKRRFARLAKKVTRNGQPFKAPA